MIILFDINKKMCEAWEKEFYGCYDIKIMNIEVSELDSIDYLVSAGNSYGIMNGGIDLAIRNLIGMELQDRIQWTIISKYRKLFLPVGDNIVVYGNEKYKNIIYAPTMEFPSLITKDNISNIFFNCLVSSAHGDMACCGLGALSGGLPVDIVAKEMKFGYNKFKRLK